MNQVLDNLIIIRPAPQRICEAGDVGTEQFQIHKFAARHPLGGYVSESEPWGRVRVACF